MPRAAAGRAEDASGPHGPPGLYFKPDNPRPRRSSCTGGWPTGPSRTLPQGPCPDGGLWTLPSGPAPPLALEGTDGPVLFAAIESGLLLICLGGRGSIFCARLWQSVSLSLCPGRRVPPRALESPVDCPVRVTADECFNLARLQPSSSLSFLLSRSLALEESEV